MTSQAKTSTVTQGAARLFRYLAMPIFLGLACLALYLYVSIQASTASRSAPERGPSIPAGDRTHPARGRLHRYRCCAGRNHRHLAYPALHPQGVAGHNRAGQHRPGGPVHRCARPVLAIIWDFGFWPAIVALVAYSFLSILRNTMVGCSRWIAPLSRPPAAWA